MNNKIEEYTVIIGYLDYLDSGIEFCQLYIAPFFNKEDAENYKNMVLQNKPRYFTYDLCGFIVEN